jgi:hypothetical protein
MLGVDLDRLVADRRRNAQLAWILVGALGALAVLEGVLGDPWMAGVLVVVSILAALPGPFYRTYTAMLPWEVLAVTVLVLGWFAVAPGSVLAEYLTFAVVALLIAFEVHLFTTVRMSHRFALLFVTISTTAMAGVWALVRWSLDVTIGTTLAPGHEALMWEFVAATVVGVLAGGAFDLYVRWWEGRLDRLTPLLEGDEA